jgi:capsule polysaccharide export protein KpsE/RkpR
MKLEPPQSQIPSESLQAKEDALRLKLKVIQLELQVIELDRQNKQLKKKCAADAVRIAALEAHIQGYPKALRVTKREVSGQALTWNRLLIYPYSPA